MGLNKGANRTWLNVGFGKIRQKAKAGDPDVVERTLQDGTKSYAIEYQSLDGKLDTIYMKTHHEYGNSWMVIISDGEVSYGLQITENSRYGADLLRRIPNLKKGEIYKFSPYAFIPQGETDEKVGLSIKTVGDEKVQSYFQTFEQGPDGKIKVTNINGFPTYAGERNDKDALKIYFIGVTKFLRAFAQSYLKSAQFEAPPEHPVATEVESDLPF